MDAAIAQYQTARHLVPNNPIVWNNLALLLRDEDPAQALRHAERAYALNQDSRIADTLGVILLDQGETARALEVLREATVKSPTQPTINYHYAKALAQSGNKEEARAVLKRVTRGDFPERAEADALLSQLGG
jgi:Flp pilus assembly protein TadD